MPAELQGDSRKVGSPTAEGTTTMTLAPTAPDELLLLPHNEYALLAVHIR